MRSLSVRSFLGAAVGVAILFSASAAQAQLNTACLAPVPKLNYIMPLGGKPATTVEVTFGGLDCDEPEVLWFSHPGIKGSPIKPEPAKVDPKADPKEMKKGKNTPPSATKFSVTIDKAVPAGLYDVRVVAAKGVSSPRVFVVNDGEEVAEKEPNNDVEQAQKVAVGMTINGAISAPTDVDYFEFSAKSGQRILFHAATASVDSRLLPEMRVFNATGQQLAYSRPIPYQDGLLDFTAPADGTFYLRLNQFTYTAGGTDFFYRLTIGTGPWIDAVHPAVVPAGKPTPVTVYGRNLPGGVKDPTAVVDGVTLEKVTVTVNAPADANKFDFFGSVTPLQGSLNGFEHRLAGSNPRFLEFAQNPVILENDDNDTPEKAQKVTLPCDIAGRIDKIRDRDWYSFDAKKGDVLIIDAASARLGAPTDLYFKLVNPANKNQAIVTQDDTPESVNLRGFYTASRDPAPYRFVVPADGTYQLLVGSHVGDIAFGPNHCYRVRIAPEQPDFRLAVMPAEDYRQDAFVVGKGGQHFFNVFAIRQDGFKGDIRLEVQSLPKGMTAAPQIIGGADKHSFLVIKAAEDAPEKLEGTIRVIGKSTVGGKEVVREARPASVSWGVQGPQVNTPTITRLDRSLMVAVRGTAPLEVTAGKDKLVVMSGDKIDIPLKMVRRDPEFKGNFQIQAQPEMPIGIVVGNATFAPGKDDPTITVTTQANAAIGRHNLVLRGFANLAPVGQAKGKGVNTIIPCSPIELTIIPKQVAQSLALDNANPTLVPGKETSVTLKLARTNDYADSFQVVVLGDGAKDEKDAKAAIKGVTVAPVTLEAGKSDVKLTFKTADDAGAGPRSNLTLRAVAVISGVPVIHDLKFNAVVMPEAKKK